MKNLKLLLVTLLAAVLPSTMWADTYQDSTTGIVYEYYTDADTAIVAPGDRPGHESDIVPQTRFYGNTIQPEVFILESFEVGGKTYTVTGIGEYALCYLPVRLVGIPKTVRVIGQMAFAGCNALDDVICLVNPRRLNWDTTTFSTHTNFKSDGSTRFHVIGGYKDAYVTKFSTRVNVQFVGDLEGDVEPDPGVLTSIFMRWDGSYGTLIASDSSRNWTLDMPTDGSTMSMDAFSWGGEACLYFRLAGGTSSVKQLRLTSDFTVNGKVKKVVVRAAGTVRALIFEKPNGEIVEGMGVTTSTAFEDLVLDFGSGIEVNAPFQFFILTGTPFILQSITIYMEDSGSVETLPSGKCGDNLEFSMEWLPYTVKNWQTQEQIPAVKLTITGRGDMYDFTSETTTPWQQYKDNIAEVSLSDEITHVGDYAFCRMWGFSWTSLPSKLTSVGAYAFYNCTFPSELHLPEGLYRVGRSGLCAFNGVKDLYVPKSLTIVEESGLTDFMGLENFHVDAANPYFTDEGNSIIEKATNTLIAGCKNTVIPEGVKVIGTSAFEDVRMESIKFPKSLVTIGALAFSYSSLKEVNIPDNVQTIERSAFNSCGQMTKATIGRGVTSIGQSVFGYCTNIFDVYCHADPNALNWTSTTYEYRSFMPDTVTVMHVKAEDVALWESKFGFLNVLFKGDLNGYVETILDETTVEVSDLKGADLTDNTVGNVYYNLSDATGSGYKDGDYLVIGKTTDISQIGSGEPGTAKVRDNFTGIILKVGPGKGTVTINARVVDRGWKTQLAVRIGNGTPTYAAKDSRWDVIVGYNVDVETYVYIYAVGNGALVRSFGNYAPEEEEEGLYIYGITVKPEDETVDIKTVDVEVPVLDNDMWYDLNGRMLQRKPTERGIYIRNGRKYLVK